eukprot:CAMPEP_0114564442 /NCGR_PEP_ID=MMETSP0114-20121206/13721_1 /TAXON_ID=31324 /ORGANISM="Goniomonas sp, Strain m" /LENGTH=197 /DNA_ID=CAMNT_0001750507 /DNA_START=131 /DNA_END=724 /DNA_ORIENTATION=+
MAEVLEEEPFAGHRKPRAQPEVEVVEEVKEKDAKEKDAEKGAKVPEKAAPVVQISNAVRLSNNLLENLNGFNHVMKEILYQPSMLAWIDLSHNLLTEIPKGFAKYEHLNVIYLHANNIQKIKEVEKLSGLKKLRSITLHGNPIETQKFYRLTVIGILPNLRSLDFSVLTVLDRERAMMHKETQEKRRAAALERARDA